MKKTIARYLDTGAGTAAWNMAVDELLFETCRAHIASGAPPDEAPLTFRVYGWSPPALSIGRNQKAERDVFVDRLPGEGVDLCRRLTGGRAVLHDREITYSVTGPEALLGDTIEESYRRISAGLAGGLRRLGAPVTFAPPGGRSYASQASCFATASVWELAIAGRKVAGSAQCREGGAILQHGSILLHSPEDRLGPLLRGRKAGANGAGPEEIHGDHAVGLCEALGREAEYGEVALALREGMAEALAASFQEEPLREEERGRAGVLARERYGNPDWTLAR
jgi:lipoate-protein ligase A